MQNNKLRKTILLVSLVPILAGCATSSKNISSTYIPPSLYANRECPQIAEELQRVSIRVSQLSGQADSNANNDALLMGAALVIFWPALFFLNGDSATKAELSRLKGEYDALNSVMISKNCGAR